MRVPQQARCKRGETSRLAEVPHRAARVPPAAARRGSIETCGWRPHFPVQACKGPAAGGPSVCRVRRFAMIMRSLPREERLGRAYRACGAPHPPSPAQDQVPGWWESTLGGPLVCRSGSESSRLRRDEHAPRLRDANPLPDRTLQRASRRRAGRPVRAVCRAEWTANLTPSRNWPESPSRSCASRLPRVCPRPERTDTGRVVKIMISCQ